MVVKAHGERTHKDKTRFKCFVFDALQRVDIGWRISETLVLIDEVSRLSFSAKVTKFGWSKAMASERISTKHASGVWCLSDACSNVEAQSLSFPAKATKKGSPKHMAW